MVLYKIQQLSKNKDSRLFYKYLESFSNGQYEYSILISAELGRETYSTFLIYKTSDVRSEEQIILWVNEQLRKAEEKHPIGKIKTFFYSVARFMFGDV